METQNLLLSIKKIYIIRVLYVFQVSSTKFLEVVII